ncbi:SDR family NAD(P)-dependent oxidoreductase [Croceicoccus hydrothermalis]|uniref:SDR family NAD(P)-dependent oxidoreductase n=1 Tax=Croceicoccus hydrothermalis TaxID=2867964 RepID=UPI001EFB70B5|nr:SDR family oxidoreductase [Croceicoccus hydrothermalis]
MDLGLNGRKAILIGANGGIGRKVAHVLAAEGCAVAVCGRSQEKVDKTKGELDYTGVTVFADTLDVTDKGAVPAFVEKAAGALGGCDIFISFTSINPGEDTDAAWETILETDILSIRRGVETARPFLQKSDAASIICMSSTGATEEFMGVQPYNAVKAAVINYASAMAQNFAADGIRVNTITPGPVMTEDGPWPHIRDNMKDFYDATLAQIPIGRLTTGEELANIIAFTASPACRAMTGANIVVDGGFTKRVQY